MTERNGQNKKKVGSRPRTLVQSHTSVGFLFFSFLFSPSSSSRFPALNLAFALLSD